MGVVYEYLTYGGKTSRDFKVWISGGGTFDTPEKDIESIAIPGRNGDLHIDNGTFKNLPITYPAFITEDWRQNFDAFRAFMCAQSGAQRLEDTYDMDHFRIATYKGAIQPKMTTLNRAGEFDIVFDCDPRRFLKRGGVPITVPYNGPGVYSEITNHTEYTAKPTIKITGNNYFQWYEPGASSSKAIRVSGVSTSAITIIDCENEEAYDEQTKASRDSNIRYIDTTEFPTLKPGVTRVRGEYPELQIIPRWWTI